MKIIDFEKLSEEKGEGVVVGIMAICAFLVITILTVIFFFAPWLVIVLPVAVVYYLYKGGYLFVKPGLFDDKDEDDV